MCEPRRGENQVLLILGNISSQLIGLMAELADRSKELSMRLTGDPIASKKGDPDHTAQKEVKEGGRNDQEIQISSRSDSG